MKTKNNLKPAKSKEGKNTHQTTTITQTRKITGISKLLLSLNIYGLSSPRKRYRLTEWLFKQGLFFCCIQETDLNIKVMGWKKIYQANGYQKQAGVAF